MNEFVIAIKHDYDTGRYVVQRQLLEDDTLHQMQELVGGPIENIGLTNNIGLYVNEEGLIIGLHVNMAACVFANQFGLVGDAVMHRVDSEGRTRGLRPEDIETLGYDLETQRLLEAVLNFPEAQQLIIEVVN